MTLTQITKIRGPGIHTTSNIVSHNINSSGIITATEFKGPFTGSSNIQSGIVTATKIDLNGDIDVDGHTNLDNVNVAGVATFASAVNTGALTATTGTFSGNVSIGGTLTYEDVTNIDSVGIITARDGLKILAGGVNVVGVVTATGVVSPYADIDDWVDVGNNIQLGNAGIITATGADINGDLDVDGHTNLDNVSVAGVTTATGNIIANSKIGIGVAVPTGTLSIASGTWQSTTPTSTGDDIVISGNNSLGMQFLTLASNTSNNNIYFGDTDDPDIGMIRYAHANNSLQFQTNTEERLRIKSNGFVGIGTDNPTRFLHVQDDSNTLLALDSTDSNADLVQSDTGGSTRIRSVSGALEFFAGGNASSTNATGSVKRLLIAADSNITQTIDTDGDGFIITAGSANIKPMLTGISNRGAVNNTIFGISGKWSSNEVGRIAFEAGADTTNKDDGHINFYTRVSGGSLTSRFHINSSGNLKIGTAAAAGGKLYFESTSGAAQYIASGGTNNQDLIVGSSAGEKLRIKSDGNLKVPDDGKLELGTYSNGEFRIWHDSSNVNYIDSPTNRQLQLKGDGGLLIRGGGNQNIAQFKQADGCDLYHNQTLTLETTSSGVTVTGEVAASQDYPNYQPTLDFNFASVKKLDPRITYYRTGTASYVDEFGIVKLVSDNAPRFDHDPTTVESKGLLIEESRTNQWLQSVTLAAYVTGGNLQQSTLADAGTSTKDPAGGYNATKMASDTNGGAHSFYKNFTSGSNGDSHTFSVWVKAAGVDYARIYVDSVGGNLGGPGVTFSTKNTWNVSASGVGTQVATSVVEYPNGWWRLSVTGSFSNRNDYYCHVDIEGGEGDISYTGNGSNGIYVWGAQFENGGFPTSYIPTNGRTVGRGADYAVIDGQEFTDFYNTEESSVFVVGNLNRPAASQGQLNILHIGDSNQDGHGIFREHGTKDAWYHIRSGNSTPSGGNLNPSGFGDWNSDQDVKIAVAFKSGDQAISVNGGNQVTATVSSGYPSANISKMWIGSHGAGAFFEGTIKRIAYYPNLLADSQLNTLTS